MAVLKKFFNQARRPSGILGKLMLTGMNPGHAKLADWGFAHLPQIEVSAAVDLGCGGGRNIEVLLRKYPKAHITGTDYSELSVQKARKHNQSMIEAGRCAIQQGDVSALQLPADTYDLATAFETIYFWPGIEQCFTQVFAILRSGGTFLICNESDGNDAAGKQFEGMIEGMRCYTSEEIAVALKAAGFPVVACWHHTSKPWITIIAKKELEDGDGIRGG